MAHVLARLRGVRAEVIGSILRGDAPAHADHGLYLEHLWRNRNDADEILFLFRVDDLVHAKDYIKGLHAQARSQNPEANLPHMTFLEDT